MKQCKAKFSSMRYTGRAAGGEDEGTQEGRQKTGEEESGAAMMTRERSGGGKDKEKGKEMDKAKKDGRENKRWRKVGERRKKEAERVFFKCRPGSLGRHYIVFVERWPSDWLGPDGEAQLTR